MSFLPSAVFGIDCFFCFGYLGFYRKLKGLTVILKKSTTRLPGLFRGIVFPLKRIY